MQVLDIQIVENEHNCYILVLILSLSSSNAAFDFWIEIQFTHWDRDEIDDIFRRHIEMHFLESNFIDFDWNFTKVFS